MIKGIIFDCFGVLVGRGFAETYRLAGGDPVKDMEFIEDMLGQANIGMISSERFAEEMAAKLGIAKDDFLAAVAQAEQPDEELLGYIAQLHGTYKTAVLSNANVGTLEKKIDPAVLKGAFDALVVSAEVGFIKPEPEIYWLTARKLGLTPEECVFIDDQPRYCEAAAAVGMRPICYENLSQLKTELKKMLNTGFDSGN